MKNTELIDSAIQDYHRNDYKSALKKAEKVLQKDEKNSDALVIKGNVYYQKHQISDSLQYYLKALDADSHHYSAQINVANTYYELKNYEQAYLYAKRILVDHINDKAALSVLGNSALEIEKYDESKEAFLEILKQDSNDVWSYNSLSKIYQKTEDENRAFAYAWKAVELSNGANEQHLNFGYLLYETEDKKEENLIKKYAQKWLEKYGQNPIVKHMGNSILHQEKMSRADGKYVREIFDVFADDFEEVLSALNYQAPRFIADEFKRILPTILVKKIDVLDVGCGTGLCGLELKKITPQIILYGVDISEKMLEKAAQKKCYKKLFKDDLENYFLTSKNKFNVIVAADVLTYFGELKNLILGFRNSLHQQGKIILTVSANTINEDDYFLHASGRFLHHRKYLEKVLSDNGFAIEKTEEKILRTEGDNDVLGYVITAEKKA